MKADLKDITFLILIRLDSIQRLENIVAVTNALIKYFDTNIMILEASDYNNGVLKSMLNKKVFYQYVEDKDPVLYKTKYFNLMMQSVSTPYISIWDADIAPDKKSIIETVDYLRKGLADAGYPYNGICYEVPDIIRKLYLRGTDFRILTRNAQKMNFLYDFRLYGGAVFVSLAKYALAGKENENYYGWGNDDFDRYARFREANLTVYRNNNTLFHLSHPRGENSQYSSGLKKKISDHEFRKRNMIFFDNNLYKPITE